MGKYTEKALILRGIEPHHNCAQSVACAFADLMGIDHDEAMKITKMYGGGAKGTCGAIMGARAAVNYITGKKNADDAAFYNDKNAAVFDKISAEFKAKNKSDLCREIKANKYRSCDGCVEDAAAILEKLIENGEVK